MTLLLLAIGLALGQDATTFAAEAEVVTVPEAPAGAEVPFTVTFTHTGGDAVSISGFDLVNTNGTAFIFDGETQLELPAGGAVQLEMLYRPTGAGQHEAALTVQSDADCALPVTVQLRGHSYEPCVIATPLVLDFGPMAPPDSDVYLITLQSCDGRTHTVDQSFISNPRFTMAAPPSFEIGPTPSTVSLQYTPIDTSSQTGELTLGSWETRIQLTANDCYGGNPESFDTDGDGTSDCGIPWGGIWEDGDGDGYTGADGDCNDNDDAVFPGAPEIDGGIDDNCDGQIDEHRDMDGDGAPFTQDCDDNDPWVHIGEDEVFDGLDNDCDGEIDDGLEAATCGDDTTDGTGEKDGCGCATPGPVGGLVWLLPLMIGIRSRR